MVNMIMRTPDISDMYSIAVIYSGLAHSPIHWSYPQNRFGAHPHIAPIPHRPRTHQSTYYGL